MEKIEPENIWWFIDCV